jgi:GNAT superfamily N-acetyltransferase
MNGRCPGFCDKLDAVTEQYPSGWTVELATLDDLNNVQAILTDRCRWLSQRHITQWPPAGFPADQIEKAIDDETVYLAKVGREVAGTFTLRTSDRLWREYPGAALYVRRMATHSSWGGRDIGGTMLSWIARRATQDARSFVRLSCMVNDGALPAYYERNGFKEIAQLEEDGVAIVLLERAAE